MLPPFQNIISYALEMWFNNDLLHIYEVRKFYNIVKVCTYCLKRLLWEHRTGSVLNIVDAFVFRIIQQKGKF